MSSTPLDRLSRPMTSLRVSVTDRCNLRCQYCMPEAEYTWLPREDILDFDEIARLVRVFVRLGVRRVRLTGGEPLLRRDLPTLVRMLARIDGRRGSGADDERRAARRSCAKRCVRRDCSASRSASTRSIAQTFTRADARRRADACAPGPRAAAARVFPGFKIDTVVVRGVNDDEVEPLLHEARTLGAELRFIEYMDVGGATRWTHEQVSRAREILAIASTPLRPVDAAATIAAWAPAERFRAAGRPDLRDHRLDDDAVLPHVRSQPADGGRPLVSLPVRAGWHDLRGALPRGRDRRRTCGAPADDVGGACRSWRGGTSLRERPRRLCRSARSRRNPHLEMHTRGG